MFIHMYITHMNINDIIMWTSLSLQQGKYPNFQCHAVEYGQAQKLCHSGYLIYVNNTYIGMLIYVLINVTRRSLFKGIVN